MDPTDRKYSKEHEWAKLDGDLAVIGITDFAQDQLGDVVYVELPASRRPRRAVEAVRRHRVGQDRLRPVRAGQREIVEVNGERR